MFKVISKVVLSIIIIVGLASCSVKEDADTYAPSQAGQMADILEGVIIAMRPVELAGSKTTGAVTGAALGALAGSRINDIDAEGDAYNTKVAAAGVAALAGGILGSLIEETITSKEAWEFIIKLSDGTAKSFVQNTTQELRVGDEVYIIQSPGQVRISRK